MKQLGVLVLFLSMGTMLLGQEFKISEETRSMSKGSFNALVIDLPGTSSKKVMKSWTKFMGNYRGKTKYSKKVGEAFTDNAEIKDMSENTVDVYAKLEELGGDQGTRLSVWFNLGVTYLTSNEHSERYPAGEEVLKAFAATVSADLIAARLKEKEKELKEVMADLKKLEKTKTGYDRDVKNYEETIKKAEEGIAETDKKIDENLKEQDTMKDDITEREKEIEEIEKRLKKVYNKFKK
ncbi:MAG: hypothetical protein GY810_31875 [Aureispira sp.]|nr:hypothetical protein [Aureispira sp.]